MKLKMIVVATLAGLLAASGCKKDNKADPATGSGSAAMTGSDTGGGGGMAGSGGGGMAGSGGAMTGSDTGGGGMAGSGGSMAGSGGGGATATLTDAEIEAVINSMIKLFEDIGKATEGKDCKGAASGINMVVDANKAFFDKFAGLADDKSIEDRAEKIMEAKGLEKKLEETAGKALGPLADKCGEDADVKAAMARLDAIK